mmetsp:Transcript_18074/g.44986  ORF Transcript_18074/g.44986 Transcript_18074/m.44986 type:complete len:82 (-) Transcript_18074:8708-8953(-)
MCVPFFQMQKRGKLGISKSLDVVMVPPLVSMVFMDVLSILVNIEGRGNGTIFVLVHDCVRKTVGVGDSLKETKGAAVVSGV